MLEELRAEIAAAGGWIPFARYMELAVGVYYGRGDRQFGAKGDFVTAPELGKLCARTLARQLRELDGPILEFGAGSGALAEVLTEELDREYLILETSAGAFVLAAIAPPEDERSPAVEGILSGAKPISDAALKSIKPLRVRVLRLSRETTLRELQKEKPSRTNLDTLALVNGVGPDDKLSATSSVKRIDQ